MLSTQVLAKEWANENLGAYFKKEAASMLQKSL